MSRPRRSELLPVWLGLAASVVLALSGCDKDAAPAPSASVAQAWDPTAPDSACQVVTEHDASSALGQDPGPGVPSSPQNPTDGLVYLHHCQYGEGRKGVFVEVSTHRLHQERTDKHCGSRGGAAQWNRRSRIHRVRQHRPRHALLVGGVSQGLRHLRSVGPTQWTGPGRGQAARG